MEHVQTLKLSQTELEATLAQIWSEVLQVQSIGRRDNFFELGGYSVLALQAAALVKDRCRVELPVWAFFMNPTIEAAARYLEKTLVEGDRSGKACDSGVTNGFRKSLPLP